MMSITSTCLASLALAFALLAQGAHADEKVVRACEGKTLSIKCEDERAYIDVKHALYGRMDKNICYKFYHGVWSKNCMSKKSLSEVQKRCNGESSCSIKATNDIFGDPCFLTEKYLEVKYTCRVDGGYSNWSDFSKCSKSCGGGIQERHRSCTEPAPKNGGKSCEGADSETRACNANPCPVTISDEKKSTVCEDKEISLSCPGNSKIMVSYAMYGRKTTNICWKIHSFIWSTTCAATNSLSIVKDECQGKTSCQISASNGVFGDPCRFTEKYLDVTYRCLG
ncbi:L-rhamnose-binding lectin CSL1-like isoform X2 [Rhopilema esculentum]|uniref:L-rhamnose-binding lectin CSL1-like isoform X2 n=1 Tax=Rhopilema esculentum TaxID=499914 RepID=UPI0031D2F088|eukprot:gene14491-5553_t